MKSVNMDVIGTTGNDHRIISHFLNRLETFILDARSLMLPTVLGLVLNECNWKVRLKGGLNQ